MNKSAIGSVVSVILVTIAVVIGATVLLRSGEEETTPQPTPPPAAASQPQSGNSFPGQTNALIASQVVLETLNCHASVGTMSKAPTRM